MIFINEISPPRKLPGLSSLVIKFDYNKLFVDIMHQIELSVYDKKSQTWEIPLTSLHTAVDLFSQYDDIDLQLLEEQEEKEDIKFQLSNYKTKPFKYQEDGIQYALNHNKFLLLDVPGLGKTLQTIYAAQEIRARFGIEHCLVICGINALKTNWEKEINKHSDYSCKILGKRISKKGKVTFGGIKERLEDLRNPIEEFFVITNIETLRNDDVIKELNSGINKFDMILFDELHCAKSSQSQQGKNLLKLKCGKYRIGMTGTVLLNSPLDAFVPLKFIGVDNSTLTNFKYYYCQFGGQFNNILVGFKNTKILKDQLEKYSLRRTKELLDLPEKTVIDQYIDMNDDQKKFYENIKNGIISQVDKVKITQASLLAMVTRLRQATACPQILTSENISSAKLDQAVELSEQIIEGGNKVVIFSTFKESANQLFERLRQYNPLLCTGDVDDDLINRNIELFQNNDENKIFIATWQKMGTGVTLTAASYAIFIDTPWTAGVYEQAQDRIHRIGSKKPVFIYNLIATDTIDERVLELVNDKAALSDYIVDNIITEKGLNSLRKYIEELN